jgi:hypothetical protein
MKSLAGGVRPSFFAFVSLIRFGDQLLICLMKNQ